MGCDRTVIIYKKRGEGRSSEKTLFSGRAGRDALDLKDYKSVAFHLVHKGYLGEECSGEGEYLLEMEDDYEERTTYIEFKVSYPESRSSYIEYEEEFLYMSDPFEPFYSEGLKGVMMSFGIFDDDVETSTATNGE